MALGSGMGLMTMKDNERNEAPSSVSLSVSVFVSFSFTVFSVCVSGPVSHSLFFSGTVYLLQDKAETKSLMAYKEKQY